MHASSGYQSYDSYRVDLAQALAPFRAIVLGCSISALFWDALVMFVF